MEALHIQKNPDGNFELSNIGLKIEISPARMFMQTLDPRTRPILDSMIEERLIKALVDFRDSKDNTKEKRRAIYDKEGEPNSEILNIALIERDLVWKLHSDGECIKLDKELFEIREYAQEVYRYSTQYGYPKIKKLEDFLKK